MSKYTIIKWNNLELIEPKENGIDKKMYVNISKTGKIFFRKDFAELSNLYEQDKLSVYFRYSKKDNAIVLQFYCGSKNHIIVKETKHGVNYSFNAKKYLEHVKSFGYELKNRYEIYAVNFSEVTDTYAIYL